MPQLLDPNFHRTVVLLVHHDASGSFGVVLNRTTEIRAERLCESIDIPWHGDPDAEICWGGPVQPQTGWVLFAHAPEVASLDDVREVTPGRHFAGSLEVLRRVAEQPPDAMRLLLGYAGWGPGQLESELAEGAWLLAPMRREVVFETAADDMWEAVVRGLGIDPTALVPARGIH